MELTTIRLAHIRYTRTPAGTTYCWAIDAETGHEVAGPCVTVKALLREIKVRYTIRDEEVVEATDAETTLQPEDVGYWG